MRGVLIGVLLAMALVACQPAEQEALPTLVSMEAIQTENAPTPTATRSLAAVLPPTFTPTPTETPSATPIPPTETPVTVFNFGTIFYVYNGDSIIALSGDGTRSELIMTFGVGQAITDLRALPDGEFLTFVANGNGSAREAFIMNRDGTYLQQISCLGFSDIRAPKWTPDKQSITWYGAPTAQTGGNIYIASVTGSNTCPNGNNQRILLPFNSTSFVDYALNNDQDTLFYSVGGDVMEYDLQNGLATTALNVRTLEQPNTFLSNPVDGTLAFFWNTGATRGGTPNPVVLFLSNLVRGEVRDYVNSGLPPGILRAGWSEDGLLLAGSTENTVFLRDGSNGSMRPVIENLTAPALVFFSPDGTQLGYTTQDRRNVTQIQVLTLQGNQTRTLTQNPEGSISYPVWVGQ